MPQERNYPCRFSPVCWLNCYGCEVARLATKEEKKEAERDLALYMRTVMKGRPQEYYRRTAGR